MDLDPVEATGSSRGAALHRSASRSSPSAPARSGPRGAGGARRRAHQGACAGRCRCARRIGQRRGALEERLDAVLSRSPATARSARPPAQAGEMNALLREMEATPLSASATTAGRPMSS